MTFISIANEIGIDISSRARGAELRAKVEQQIRAGNKVVLDFVGVRTISDSFADELFGVLLEDYSDIWFRENVEVRNIAQFPRKTILGAIEQRKLVA
ncbi:MAG TPA: STAS-like domain-containing protein [Pirellulales bacterium]|jgi:hypothetical protein